MKGVHMFDNLSELISAYPIGTKIRIVKEKRDDYANGKFIVDGYLYKAPDQWYPAHQLWDGKWEVYNEE